MDETQHQPGKSESSTVTELNDMERSSIIKEGQEMFDFFGKSHMMMLAAMFAKSRSSWRFNEIRDETDISQTTLSTRLTELVEAELVVRRSYDEIPPRVEYEATQKLRDLGPIFKDILAWWRDVD